MKKVTLEVRVGIFLLLALLILGTFIFSKGILTLRKEGYEIKVAFNFVSGLEPGAAVRVSGVRVGEVKEIEVMYEERPKVIVALWLKKDVKLGRSSQILIRSLGLVGDRYVEIMPTSLTDIPLIKDKDLISGIDPIPMERLVNLGEDMIRDITQVLAAANDILADEEIKISLNKIFKDFLALTTGGKELITKINSFIGKTEGSVTTFRDLLEANKENLQAAITNSKLVAANLKETTERVNNFLKLAEEGKSTLGKLVKDDKLYSDLRSVLKEAEASAISFRKSTEEFNAIVSKLKSGEGTVGKLIASDELHREALSLLKEIRRHPWRLLRVPRGEK
ncbi:MAG: MCE family protein [Candidatus Omnitrophica bacterium]|nr:MCE family protein [Candidatus Omnitrophota bacterium]